MNKHKKVVLAYSGGLDTSIILKWLLEQGCEVIAYIADIGQKEDFEAAKAKALKIGASKVYIENMQKELVTDYIFPAYSANVIYEDRYLLGTSLARPLIAKKQIEIAAAENADYVSHGATGKGNDQIRFELSYYSLNPDIKVLAPWKMEEFTSQFKGRQDLLNYAEKHGIPVSASRKKPYSEDENLLHISHEAGVIEDPNHICEEEIYSHTTAPENAPDKPEIISVFFKDGIPCEVASEESNIKKSDPLELFLYLNQLGAKHGIGRLDMVENRFVGIKSRGIYETPGGTILRNAHIDIESITMDREVKRIRDMLSAKMSDLIYYGFWFSPEMNIILKTIKECSKGVNGTVKLKLYKGVAYPIARISENSLYNDEIASMDIEGGYNQIDAAGFIKVNAVRLKANKILQQSQERKVNAK